MEMIRIIKEEDGTSPEFVGRIEVASEKLYPKYEATEIAEREATKRDGVPLLCEYEAASETGRSVKRYLALVAVKERKTRPLINDMTDQGKWEALHRKVNENE